MAVATAALQEGVITPDFKVHCGGSATFYGRPFKCWKKGGHGTMDLRHAIEQSCNVYFYTVGNMTGIDKIHKWATLLGLGEKSGIDLPNEVQGLVPSTEWKQAAHQGEVVRGRDHLGVDRPGRGVGDAGVDGGLRGDARQRRHARDAAPAQGGRRRDRLEAGAAAAAAVAGRRSIPTKLQAIRDGLWMVVNGGGTGGKARIKGRDVAGKTGTAQVISNQGQGARGARPTRICATTAGSSSSRRATSPRSPASSSSSTACTGRTPRLVAHHVLDTFFAKKEGRPLPPPPEDSSWITRTRWRDVSRARSPTARALTCSNDDSTTTSTGRCSSRSSRSARSASR